MLLRLTTFRGSLPQGAPTSPALSNLVNWRLDRDLREMATLTLGRYSRYCDDLAFSWPTQREPTAWRNHVEERLRQDGYVINKEKGWRLQRASDHPELVGVAIQGSRLAPSNENQRKLRRLRRTENSHRRRRLQGFRGFLKMLR